MCDMCTLPLPVLMPVLWCGAGREPGTRPVVVQRIALGLLALPLGRDGLHSARLVRNRDAGELPTQDGGAGPSSAATNHW